MKPLIMLAAIIFTISLSTTAFAQFDSTDKSSFGVGMISFMPSASQAKELSNNWFGPTIDYQFRFDKKDRPSNIISLGLLNQEKNGISANFITLTAAAIQRFPKDSDTCWYAGAGLNFSSLKYKYLWLKDSSYGTGFSLQFGREWNIWYIGMRYDSFGRLETRASGDFEVSGLSFTIGSRFTF